VPCDFDGINRIREYFRGNTYDDYETLKSRLEDAVEDLSEKGSFQGIQNLPKIWQKIIDIGGEYAT
jgi:hypothetical protein